MTWASFDDISDRWVGPNAPTDELLVNTLIGDAEALILSEFPRIQERINSGALPQRTVIRVVCSMVERKLRNPGNLSAIQQQTGPFGQSQTFTSGGQGLQLTPDEFASLAPKRRGKAFSIDLAPDAHAWGSGVDYE